MKANNNAKKGRSAEETVAKKLGGERKAGPNNPDIKKWPITMEVKKYKNPLTVAQLQNAYKQNHAKVIVSVSWFTDEAIEHAKKNMPTVQLREGEGWETVVKKKTPAK